MNDTYRGFQFERVLAIEGGMEVDVIRATRGRLTLHMRGTEANLPEGWTLEAVLSREIDRLIDPKALRGVEHLN
jgi:hypothetical protein